ncbi:hypothetical protein [Moraxella lincolnii]|uniref:hypothetical protein n=1 Tax=Lwoffella lincolnii TaxID=90241 RepID=UPI00398432C3
MAYVCAELEKVKNIYGGYDCKMWVENSQNGYLSHLAITKAEMVQISASLSAFFSIVLAFVILAKAVKSM